MNNQPIRKTHDENDYMSYDILEVLDQDAGLIIDNVISSFTRV